MSAPQPLDTRRPRLLAALGLLAAVAVVALLLTWDRALPATTSAVGPGPGMSLGAPATVFIGEPFQVTVNADLAPDVEIVYFGSEVLFPVGLKWQPRPSCEDEVRVRKPNGVSPFLCQSEVTTPLGGAGHAVITASGPPPIPAFAVVPNSTTALVELDFVCNTPGSYQLTLTANPDSPDGAVFASTDATKIQVKTVQHDYDGDTVPNQVADTIDIDCVVHLGDVDCNSLVSIADAQLIAQLMAGRISGLACPDHADVNGSGVVDITDAQLIAQLIVGRIASFPGS